MATLLIFGMIGVPILMLISTFRSPRWNYIYALLSIVSIWIFGGISANAIYRIIRDNTVFMTNIHGIFLNPFFLLTGAYLGCYASFLLLKTLFKRNRPQH